MTDRYANFAQSGPGRFFVRRLGLPDPPRLRRRKDGDPAIAGPVYVGVEPGALVEPVGKLVESLGGATGPSDDPPDRSAVRRDEPARLHGAACALRLLPPGHPLARPERAGRRVRHATRRLRQPAGGDRPARPRGLHPLAGQGGRPRLDRPTGVCRHPAGEEALESTLRFLLSGRSAYVSGQVIRVGPTNLDRPASWDQPMDGKVAIVTGAARGIGEAIAGVLAREGAHVVCVDVPATGDALSTVANDLKGTALQLDITADDAPSRLADFITTRHVHADVFVHNAGITRDKTLGRMAADQWDTVLEVNLASQERINDVLHRTEPARRRRPHHHRVVGVRHRRQPRADQLRDVQGRRHRHRRDDGADARRPRHDHQRGRARLHRDEDDRRDADDDPRGRAAA